MTMNYGMMMNPYMMGTYTTGTDLMSSGMYGMTSLYNPTAQINYMNQMDQYATTRQVNLYRNQNNAGYQMSAQTDDISKQVSILAEKAKGNNQNAIQDAYDSLVSSVKAVYGTQISGATEDEVDTQARAYAESLYAQQIGSTLTSDIRSNAGGSFAEGFKQIVTLGLTNRVTSEENVAKINKTKVSTAEQAKKTMGQVAGGATLVTGALLLNKYSRPIGKAIGAVAKFLFTRV